MNNKTFIYPYSNSFSAYLNHIRSCQALSVLAAVIPGRWGEGIGDAGYINDGEKIGIPVSCDVSRWLKECDTIIWANYEFYENDSFRQKVVDFMRKAVLNGKNIICFERLSIEEMQDFQLCAKRSGATFAHETDKNYIEYDKALEEINIPVLTVLGMAENCSKFETELGIYRALTNRGYKVSLVSSKNNAELLGVKSFPSFMFSSNYGEIEKIKLFSSFIHQVIHEDNPDVIVLGVPGGLIPFNNLHNMHYGITAYEILSIIKPDYNIVNVWTDYLVDGVINDLLSICKYRHGIALNAIGVSNISIYNDHSTIGRKNLEYNVYDSKTVDKAITREMPNHIGLKMINVLKQSSFEELADDIIYTLSE